MEQRTLDPKTEKRLLRAQKNEITQHQVYEKLSRAVHETHNQEILRRIAAEELKHHDICLNFTCQDIRPNRLKVWMYYLMAAVFGITFSLKFMERAEGRQHVIYSEMSETMPETVSIAKDEIRHEKELLDLIDDDRLNYSADIVRGMNVAIVEITGTLAGLTFAFQDSRLVVETMIIVGIILSLSVMSTEFLAAKAEVHILKPLKALFYAGFANILTILVLLTPYFFLSNIYLSLLVTIAAALVVIYVFSFYISVAQGVSIKSRFLEMTGVSLGIAALAFGIGLLAREILDIEVL